MSKLYLYGAAAIAFAGVVAFAWIQTANLKAANLQVSTLTTERDDARKDLARFRDEQAKADAAAAAGAVTRRDLEKLSNDLRRMITDADQPELPTAMDPVLRAVIERLRDEAGAGNSVREGQD